MRGERGTATASAAAGSPAEEEWKKYFKRGNQLCKYETEDLDEFLLLSTIEQEEYISSTAMALCQKDKVGNKNFGKCGLSTVGELRREFEAHC